MELRRYYDEEQLAVIIGKVTDGCVCERKIATKVKVEDNERLMRIDRLVYSYVEDGKVFDMVMPGLE